MTPAESGAIGAACEIPATATKTKPAIAIAEKVRIIVLLPILLLAGSISDLICPGRSGLLARVIRQQFLPGHFQGSYSLAWRGRKRGLFQAAA